ncbi:putative PurR-regulated permease PerM [Microlunatus panaciterrae]|uniref:PurR-regulated permease PerM n=1 Tax=Microlunatus panaciterrae TaxID=400768 RepID=A0ABS2RFR6_9ACTN|nr:putative PurR-regulated permease PerM [Microlunatus panaciterrae]
MADRDAGTESIEPTGPEHIGPQQGAATGGEALTPGPSPEATRVRRPLQLMSPFRIGFTGTIGAMLAYGLALAVIQARSVLILIVVAMFIALGLNPMVEMLTRRRLKRSLAVLVVFFAVVLVLALATLAIVPVFSEQISSLIDAAPGMLGDLQRNPQIAAVDQQFQLLEKAQQFLTSGGLVTKLFGGILGAGKVVLSAVFSALTLLILTLYFLATMPTIKRALYRLAPASRRDRVRYLADEIFDKIGAYLGGMFVVVTTAGLLTFIFLMVIGMHKYALALAVVVAILDFIPMVGATIAAVIVCVIAFVQSPVIGIAAVVFYVLYQQFENYVVQPRVMKRSVNVPGSVVVVAALIGGTLLGVVGALLAVPTAAAILILMREVAQPRLDAH